MRQFAAFFLYVMMIGCLRPVWGDSSLITLRPAASSRNGTPPVEPDPVDDGIDHYRISFDHATLRPWRIAFWVSPTETYRLGCTWQSDVCIGNLPAAARETRIIHIGLPRRSCARIRIYREEEEVSVMERFRWGCGFVLDAPMENPP